MDLITAEEALVADELLDELEGLGVVPFHLLPAWARGKPTPRAVSPVRRRPRWLRRAEEQREPALVKKQRLTRLAAQNQASADRLRVQAQAELTRAKRAQANSKNLMVRVDRYQRLANQYKRQADAIITFKAVTV